MCGQVLGTLASRLAEFLLYCIADLTMNVAVQMHMRIWQTLCMLLLLRMAYV
jgi:hypothetical protein